MPKCLRSPANRVDETLPQPCDEYVLPFLPILRVVPMPASSALRAVVERSLHGRLDSIEIMKLARSATCITRRQRSR